MGKVLSIILRLPMWALVLASCAVAYYAAYTKTMDVTWAVPIIYTVILVCYLLGLMLKDKVTDEETSKVNVEDIAEQEKYYKELTAKQ